jgi:excisionase family DNA binding protein
MTAHLLTVEAVAEEISMSEKHVRRLIRLGELVAVNVASGKGRTYRVTRAALDAFLTARAVSS